MATSVFSSSRMRRRSSAAPAAHHASAGPARRLSWRQQPPSPILLPAQTHDREAAALRKARTGHNPALLNTRSTPGHRPNGGSRMNGPALGEDRIDHLQRHDLGQLTQMTRREHATGYHDHRER